MQQKNIDDVLNNTRSMIRMTGELESDDTFAGVTVAQIFGEIDALANTMHSDLSVIAVSVKKDRPVYRDAKKAVKILEKLDAKASKFALYKKIRPLLQKRFAYLKNTRFADGKKLLALDNSELIIALYQTVLGREPEQGAIDAGLLFLTGAGINKLDLIDTILASDEAKTKGVRLKGLTFKRLLLRLRRTFFGSAYVDVRKILKHGGIDFVAVLYRTVLRREPDADAIISGVKFLDKYGNHKIDLLVAVAGSEEAKRHNVKIKGLKIRHFLLRCKRKIYRIPLFGYMARWFASVVMLPKRIDYMLTHIEKMQSNNEELHTHVGELENKAHALDWYVSDQNEKRLALEKNVQMLNAVQDQLCSSVSTANEQYKDISGHVGELENKAHALDCYVSDQNGKRLALEKHVQMLNAVQDQLCSSVSTANEQYKDISGHVATLRTDLDEMISKREAEIEKKRQKEQEDKALIDKLYVNYNEKLLPDSRESVKQGVRPYLDKLNIRYPAGEREKIHIVDLGCGECEWVELLCENQYDVIGVDSNSQVVKKVMETLPAISIVENNALDYLKNCADNSVDVLTCFHMVEHMELMELMELLKECHRVLKKDGILLAETPNPQNLLIATYYFYLDPTHKKPIPHELLAFLMQEAGFVSTESIFRNPLNFEPYEYRADDPIKDIVFRFNLEQAYAIWAVK